jgi:hypothetical protein
VHLFVSVATYGMQNELLEDPIRFQGLHSVLCAVLCLLHMGLSALFELPCILLAVA